MCRNACIISTIILVNFCPPPQFPFKLYKICECLDSPTIGSTCPFGPTSSCPLWLKAEMKPSYGVNEYKYLSKEDAYIMFFCDLLKTETCPRLAKPRGLSDPETVRSDWLRFHYIDPQPNSYSIKLVSHYTGRGCKKAKSLHMNRLKLWKI